MSATPALDSAPAKKTSRPLNPAIILLSIVFLAMVLTYVVRSGQFERQDIRVIPGTYQVLEKDTSLSQLFSLQPRSTDKPVAQPVSLAQTFLAIPLAIEKRAGLIFMVLFIGGMFAVLNKTGTIDAGLDRLLGVTKGNVYILVPTLMLALSAGSTFMGLAKEYIMFVPVMVAMANRLGLPNIVGLAIVALAVKTGYMGSISNPIALSVAQPLVGLPVFSGLSMRVVAYFTFVALAVGYLLFYIRRSGFDTSATFSHSGNTLSLRHTLSLITLGLGVGFLVYASNTWHWKYPELSAYYLALTIAFAAIAGMRPSTTASIFVEGMNKMLMAGVLIALATAVESILASGQVLDTIVNGLSQIIGQHGQLPATFGMFFAQMGLDVVIPSTSGQAAVTMPIFGPLGQLAGVSPQTTVYAFLLGNGLTNMITPTSSGLLVLLAAANVGWVQWAKFVMPLFLLCTGVALLLLAFAALTGY
ncbi:YfcC family protein [Pseudomonas nabeulensis]|uniref:YfcC family protein n=1 Tax=Pseudomonas nabeulensis TaxID=2293833 RepID=A0A4Z0B3L6_9PSED|nr:Na+/H+ antiporter NhaC family protein [Pseudomonas nabeulensis]TFY93147.1 YfcC family protein [Pseudomonas nabeulensis]